MQSYKTHNSSLMLLVSLFLHILVLGYLFLALFQPQLHNFFPKTESSALKIPVIIAQPKTNIAAIAQPKAPAHLPRQLPKEEIPVAQLPGTAINTTTKALVKNQATTDQCDKNNKSVDKKTASLKNTSKTSSTIIEAVNYPSLFSVPQEIKKTDGNDHYEDNGDLRSKKLTLADLFKSLLPPQEKSDNVTTDGMLIISQGDMKYYSFLQKFITHINQVFAFHGGPAQVRNWLQKGFLQKNTALSIIIDKKGSVLDVDITQSSGYIPFDELSIKTVHQASPFPPIPDRIGHDKVRVDLSSYL